MTNRKPRRATAPAARPGRRPGARGAAQHRQEAGPFWLFGVHPVLAAAANPRRSCRRLLLSAEAEHRIGPRLRAVLDGRSGTGADLWPGIETAGRDEIGRMLPPDAVHQGLAALVERLDQPDLADLLDAPRARPAAGDASPRPVLVVLDQVTDPHNVGAILRSAAAFGACAVIAPKRHAAPESGTLAKAASGALDVIPYLPVANLARALAEIKAAGFWTLGLAGEADRALAEADPGGPIALVLGAEGPGLRRLTREACDVLARLPTRPPIEALNVSNAAAVALYELLADDKEKSAPK